MTETTTQNKGNAVVLFKTNEIEAARTVRNDILDRCRNLQPWVFITIFVGLDNNEYEVSVTDKHSGRFNSEVISFMQNVVTSSLEKLTEPKTNQ